MDNNIHQAPLDVSSLLGFEHLDLDAAEVDAEVTVVESFSKIGESVPQDKL